MRHIGRDPLLLRLRPRRSTLPEAACFSASLSPLSQSPAASGLEGVERPSSCPRVATNPAELLLLPPLSSTRLAATGVDGTDSTS